MAFNLKKVLKALLLSSSQPLAIKDIQAAFTRFHEQATELPIEVAAGADTDSPPASAAKGPDEKEAVGGDHATPATSTAESEEAVEVPIESALDPELYSDVPSLITATQIRDAMDQIAAELVDSAPSVFK